MPGRYFEFEQLSDVLIRADRAAEVVAAQVVAAHTGPRTPEAPPPAREAAVEAAAEASGAGEEREVHQPAEASEQSEVVESEKIAEAIRHSELEAAEAESQQLSEALMRSKADRWSADGVALLRLTCVKPDITQLLLTSEPLAPCRERMCAAGCEMTPSWAGGALLLVPITEGQISEAGIQLRPHHVLVLSSEQDLVEQTLRQCPRKKGRPQLKPEHDPDGEGASTVPYGERHREPAAAGYHAHAVSPADPSASAADLGTPDPPASGSGSGSSGADGGAAVAEWQAEWIAEVGLVVERTFLHVPVEVSEASAFVESAPACPGEPADQVRRWRAETRGQ